LTVDEVRELRARLNAIAKRNAALAWTLVIAVLALSVAGFAVTAAAGGTLGLVSGGFATMFIVPLGAFLRSLWREKYRLEALFEILPVLSPAQVTEALTRFLYRDAAD